MNKTFSTLALNDPGSSSGTLGTTMVNKCLVLLVALCASLVGCNNDAPTTSPDSLTNASVTATRKVPRFPDGTVNFDRIESGNGYWGNPSASSLVETGVTVAMDGNGLLANIGDAAMVAPFQPWALGLYRYRQANGLKDDPIKACISPSGPRHFHTDGGFRIIQDRNFNRVYAMFGGGNRGWRVIYLDGRTPPSAEDVFGSYYGHSTGSWEGDTLVVKSTTFNDRFWFSNGGLPHTEALQLIERFSRPEFGVLEYEVTIDDPLAYERPWTSSWTLEWMEGTDIKVSFCEDTKDA